jgi:hypothetical protein
MERKRTNWRKDVAEAFAQSKKATAIRIANIGEYELTREECFASRSIALEMSDTVCRGSTLVYSLSRHLHMCWWCRLMCFDIPMRAIFVPLVGLAPPAVFDTSSVEPSRMAEGG